MDSEEPDTSRFDSSLQHLGAELQRLDVLLRLQVWRVRQARDTHENLSPFVIPEDEVDALLDAQTGSPLWALAPLAPEVADEAGARLAAMAAATDEMREGSIEAGVELRLDDLCERFGLDPLERDLVLVALAPEIDTRYGRLYAYLQDNVTLRRPSVNLALQLLLPNLGDRLMANQLFTADAALQRHRLLRLEADPSLPDPPWLDRVLSIEPRVVAYLLEGDDIDARIRHYVEVMEPVVGLDDLRLPDGHAKRLAALTDEGAIPLLYLQGGPGRGAQELAEALCDRTGEQLCVVDGARLVAETPAEGFGPLLQLIDREARLHDAGLYWMGFDALLAEGADARRRDLLAVAADRPSFTFLGGERAWEPSQSEYDAPFFRVELPALDYLARRDLWAEALALASEVDDGEAPEFDLDPVAATFRFNATQIADSAATAHHLARWRDPTAPVIETADLYAAGRLHSNRKLAELAQRIEPHYGWDDIVLPEDRVDQLRAICDQMAYRGKVYDEWGFDAKLAMGKGINALFAGPPGTGKTMAADVIANELQLALYKIDLSTVVSKYIGETEKNLARIFEEAVTSNAILFFDEADALFGKRTEVRDSHDRYANLEVSYLLQKMEAYDGIVVLATNLQKNMDDAFRRRLHFIIDFPFPGVPERRRIWEQVWPPEVPLAADVDFDRLAREVELAGGNIRNVALAAAFKAASRGSTVSDDVLAESIRSEMAKIGKLL